MYLITGRGFDALVGLSLVYIQKYYNAWTNELNEDAENVQNMKYEKKTVLA